METTNRQNFKEEKKSFSQVLKDAFKELKETSTEMSTETMWFFYGLIAIITPIGLVFAKKWVMKDFKVKAEV